MFVATTLALSLVLSPVSALTGAPLVALVPAATPASKPAGPACAKLDYRARVDVDAAGLGADAQGVATRLRSKAENELQRNDIMLSSDAGANVPRMVVKVVPLPGEDGGYSFTIDINHADAAPIKDGSSVGECPLCTESELLEKIVGATRALAPKLRAYVSDYNNRPCDTLCSADADCKDPTLSRCNQQSRKCEAATKTPGVCGSDADCGPNQSCDPAARTCVDRGATPPPPSGLNGKQKAGIGLLAGGVVGAGVGIGLLAKPPVYDDAEAWTGTTTRPPGIALLAVGGVAVVSGVVLFLLGRRQAQQQKQARNVVNPVAGAGFYGLSWSGRF